MASYVTLMRAINVAGHARVTMRVVHDAFLGAGCQHVRTIGQSGNVLFDTTSVSVTKTLEEVRRRLRPVLGEEPQMVLKTLGEMAQIIERGPFAGHDATSAVKLYVAFLLAAPRRRPTFPIVSSQEALEAVSRQGREVFIISRPKKNGFFGFPNNFIEEELGVAATSRNWSTVTKIVQSGMAAQSTGKHAR
jgi:uncharacterized protein (DUF1697 family)